MYRRYERFAYRAIPISLVYFSIRTYSQIKVMLVKVPKETDHASTISIDKFEKVLGIWGKVKHDAEHTCIDECREANFIIIIICNIMSANKQDAIKRGNRE